MDLLDDNFDVAQAAAGGPLEWVRPQDLEPEPGYWYEATVASDPHLACPSGHRFYFGKGVWSYHTEGPRNEADPDRVLAKYSSTRPPGAIRWWRGPRLAQIAGIPKSPSRS